MKPIVSVFACEESCKQVIRKTIVQQIEQKADINAPEIAFGNTSDEKMVLSRQMPSESSSVYYDAEMTPPDSTALANVTDTSEKK